MPDFKQIGEECWKLHVGFPIDPATEAGKAFARLKYGAWSETIPTEQGRYLVLEPGADVELWRLDDDPTGEDRPWVGPWGDRFRFGSWEPGTLFLPCPEPPKRVTP